MQLEERYNMIMEEKVIEDMCNLSQYHESVGMDKGIAIGQMQNAIAMLTKITKNMNISLTEAMNIAEVSDDLRPAILEHFKER